MNISNAILNFISENPGKTKTQIFQSVKIDGATPGQRLNVFPVAGNKHILELTINGLIQIEGNGGTYSITEEGIKYLALIKTDRHAQLIKCPNCNKIQTAEVLHTMENLKMTEAEKATFRIGCLDIASKLKQNPITTEEHKTKSVIALAGEFSEFVLGETGQKAE